MRSAVDSPTAAARRQGRVLVYRLLLFSVGALNNYTALRHFALFKDSWHCV